MRAGPKAAITVPPLELVTRRRGGSRVQWFLESYLHSPKGTGARRPFKVRPWQRSLLDGLFDAPRPRQGLVSIPRGNGKSTLAAALGLYGLFGDDVEGPQVLVVASDERQAGLVLAIARRMVELSPELTDRVQVFRDRLYVPHCDGTFMALPAEPAALHGWDPSLLIVDELHVVNRDTWEAATSAAGKRDRSLTLAISTPSTTRDSIMWSLVEYGRQHDDDPLFYFREWNAPTGCDLWDEHAWAVANPGLDDLLHRDGLRAVARTMRPETFRRLRLGQWVEDEITWIPHTDWKACEDRERTLRRSTRVVVGFDGSISGDSTAMIGCTVEASPHLFTLGIWADDGTPGWRVPREEVGERLADTFDTFDVVEVAADPYGWRSELEAWTKRYGPRRVLEWPTNMHKRAAPAAERLYAAVRDRSLSHDGDPLFSQHVLNAVVKPTPSGDVIVKDRRWSPRKIDAAVAATIALDRAAWHAARDEQREAVFF